MYGLETAQRQYDAQYPENELLKVLTCSVCGFEEQRKNTYTVDGKIMCEGCFDDFCAEMYDEHGTVFFEEHKEEYAKDWFENLEDKEQKIIILSAYERYLRETEEDKLHGCSCTSIFEQRQIKGFCLRHGDWKDYIKRVECVEENKE